MSVTHAKYFQVLVDDSNVIDPPKAKEPKDEEPESNGSKAKDSDNEDVVPDTVISDEEDGIICQRYTALGINYEANQAFVRTLQRKWRCC